MYNYELNFYDYDGGLHSLFIMASSEKDAIKQAEADNYDIVKIISVKKL